MWVSKEDKAKICDASIRTLCGRVDGCETFLPAVELAYELQRAVCDVGGRWFAIPDVRETREYVPVRSVPAGSEGKDQHLVRTKLVSAPNSCKSDAVHICVPYAPARRFTPRWLCVSVRSFVREGKHGRSAQTPTDVHEPISSELPCACMHGSVKHRAMRVEKLRSYV